MRLPLIDGQGNFGSMDGDPPAAYRYTEARLARVADTLLDDLDKDTVDFQPNYDDTEQRAQGPAGRFPEPPGQWRAAASRSAWRPTSRRTISARSSTPAAPISTTRRSPIDELMEYVPAPDFPTGGIIIGRAGTHAAYQTGRGAVVMRAKTHVEEIRKDRDAIVFTEIPYQVNKAKLVERIAETVREKLDRGHLRSARRERPRGPARRHRTEARRRARHRPQPALPPHGAADELRRQHAGAERWPARAIDPARHHRRLHRLPRGGDHPAHEPSARQGARAGACAARAARSRSPISTRSLR